MFRFSRKIKTSQNSKSSAPTPDLKTEWMTLADRRSPQESIQSLMDAINDIERIVEPILASVDDVTEYKLRFSDKQRLSSDFTTISNECKYLVTKHSAKLNRNLLDYLQELRNLCAHRFGSSMDTSMFLHTAVNSILPMKESIRSMLYDVLKQYPDSDMKRRVSSFNVKPRGRRNRRLLGCTSQRIVIYRSPHRTADNMACNDSSKKTRVALLGACGRMGNLLIRRILATEGMELSAAFDLVNVGKDVGEAIGVGHLGVPVSDSKDLAQVLKDSGTEVLIDFTVAPATAANAPVAAAAGVNLIIGTTGLTAEQKTNITEAVVKNNVAAVISSNYSIGVGVFFKLIRDAAKYLGDAYDVEIIEAHHNQKKDAPSGTAVTAAEIISDAMGGKDIIYGREGVCPRGKEICIHAVRGGDIVGDHTVMFIGNSERIEIRHQAHSREIFVGGAVMAAGWVVNQKKGVVYEMSDVLN